MTWVTVSSWSCFCYLYRASPSLAAKNIINLISVLTVWWCPCDLLCCWKRVLTMINAFSCQNLVSLCPASFCTPRPNLPVTPGISWFLLLHSSPLCWKGHLFLALILEGLVGFHRTILFLFIQHLWLGHRLGLLWYRMVCLGNKQRSFCHFWDCTQVLHFGLFCWLWGLLHFF